ncbi:hypothetical protein TNIN_231851 [Trichonephila inaurata madagascariensis]|uniref:Uncharacterized protein n=1 Tax=Trichonephila inaurata madagascariensis TaxID=2747483 RepID=A0A8X6Y3X1_9ARAC|nr:hypothetical protein TNIN_231851 [Trichonephila inaurata madagascariensis]
MLILALIGPQNRDDFPLPAKDPFSLFKISFHQNQLSSLIHSKGAQSTESVFVMFFMLTVDLSRCLIPQKTTPLGTEPKPLSLFSKIMGKDEVSCSNTSLGMPQLAPNVSGSLVAVFFFA